MQYTDPKFVELNFKQGQGMIPNEEFMFDSNIQGQGETWDNLEPEKPLSQAIVELGGKVAAGVSTLVTIVRFFSKFIK